jgi:hypothetical protein
MTAALPRVALNELLDRSEKRLDRALGTRRFFQAVLTPGITRRHERLKVHDERRVGGRVHALVRRILPRLLQRLL